MPRGQKSLRRARTRCPSYDKKITDAEVKDVIAYMRSLCK